MLILPLISCHILSISYDKPNSDIRFNRHVLFWEIQITKDGLPISKYERKSR